MNLGQSFDYEPTGIALRRFVRAVLARKSQPKRKRPSRARFVPGLPKLHGEQSIALWKVISVAKEPMTKQAWMDAAGLHGHSQRVLGASAIVNLLRGEWITCKRGLYQTRTSK